LGNEVPCTMRRGRETFAGKAILESAEILFRGDMRFKIAFTAITSIDAVDGQLRVRTKDGLTVFALGPQAEKWREKIANPKPLLAKLALKAGGTAALVGAFPADFVASLKKWSVAIIPYNHVENAQTIFVAAESSEDLKGLLSIGKVLRGATAVWVVYPKGARPITEQQVRSRGLAAGLVDIKVVSFSPTHTALKFVLPKSKR
jgi:hypothetical protein